VNSATAAANTISGTDYSVHVYALAVEGVLHELGNCLNRIALEAALMQARLGPEHGSAVETIRSEVRAAASAIRPLQLAQKARRPASRINLAVLLPETTASRPCAWINANPDDASLLIGLLSSIAGEGSIELDNAGPGASLTVSRPAHPPDDDLADPLTKAALMVLLKRTGARAEWSVQGNRLTCRLIWAPLTDSNGAGPQDASRHDASAQ